MDPNTRRELDELLSALADGALGPEPSDPVAPRATWEPTWLPASFGGHSRRVYHPSMRPTKGQEPIVHDPRAGDGVDLEAPQRLWDIEPREPRLVERVEHRFRRAPIALGLLRVLAQDGTDGSYPFENTLVDSARHRRSSLDPESGQGVYGRARATVTQ